MKILSTVLRKPLPPRLLVSFEVRSWSSPPGNSVLDDVRDRRSDRRPPSVHCISVPSTRQLDEVDLPPKIKVTRKGQNVLRSRLLRRSNPTCPGTHLLFVNGKWFTSPSYPWVYDVTVATPSNYPGEVVHKEAFS